MIVYDSTAHWFRDILNSFKSETIVRLFKRGALVGVFSTVIVVITKEFFPMPQLISGEIFTWIGVALSILMVFRTNTAYDRWWEGRKQWGELINHSRSLALLINAKLPKHDEENRRYFARNVTNYAFALSGHLRGVFKKDLLYDVGDNDEKLLDIHHHAPNYIAKKLYARTVRLVDQGKLSEFVELKMLDHLAGYNTITGACERIKNTPIPFSYRAYLKIFIFIYTLLLPFAYVNSLGYFSIIVTVLEFFVLIGLEMMAEEIEDPFENNGNDLPTRTLSLVIKNNVYEILGFYEEVDAPKKPELYKVID